jgi:hypothetical protein
MSSTTKTLQITQSSASGKRKKGSKSPSGATKTSIVDNLLKDRKSPVSGSVNSKKLVLDLNSDNYIITESKSAKQAKVDVEYKAMPIKRISSPVIEPIILAAQEITRSGSPKPSSHPNTPAVETRDKLDIFKNIDSVITSRPEKSISIDLESGPVDNELASATDLPIAGSSQGLGSLVGAGSSQGQDSLACVGTKQGLGSLVGAGSSQGLGSLVGAGSSQGQDSLAETQSKLTAAKDAISKINDKIKRKGPSEKYTKLLEQLNSKVNKYTRILETPKPLSSKSHPIEPTIAPPTYKESGKHELIGSSQANKLLIQKPEETRQVYGNVKPAKSTPSPVNQQGKSVVVSAIDSELARARTLLQDSSKTASSKPAIGTNNTQAQTMSAKKKERSSVFDVSTSIDTLREKQTHLQEQQRKLQDQYAHKLKQIEKMKSQKVEIQKLQALEAERRKIYEMEQKLKTLEREQWKEQQALRKELHQLGVSNHKTHQTINAKDRGELFSLKQELSRPVGASGINTTTTASAGILSYLYDKWSTLTKIPMGEVIDIPQKQPSSPTKSVVESKPVVEVSEVKSTKPTEPPVKNIMTYAGRFVYLVDFPESEFADGERVIQVTCSDYVIPFDAAWLDTQCRDLTLDNECLSTCNKVGIDGDSSSDNKYIQENYKTRIVTNMDLISGSRGIDFYMAIVAQRNGNNELEEALATLAMFYSLLIFYEANR